MTFALALGLFVGGATAGALGAFAGIGGGVVLVPLLLVLFGFDVRQAVSTSLIAVVATSTAAGSVYVGKGLTHVRLGLTLELATAVGGFAGGLLAGLLPETIIAGLLAAVLLLTSIELLRRALRGTDDFVPMARGEVRGVLAAKYVDSRTGEATVYEPRRLPLGMSLSGLAGVLSGLLGVGGGFLKVPTMVFAMGMPTRAAAATSSFMLGVTASASLLVYAARGDVHPLLAAPVVLGAVGGSRLGARAMMIAPIRAVRIVLGIVLGVVALQLVRRAMGAA